MDKKAIAQSLDGRFAIRIETTSFGTAVMVRPCKVRYLRTETEAWHGIYAMPWYQGRAVWFRLENAGCFIKWAKERQVPVFVNSSLRHYINGRWVRLEDRN